jgi:hypothetical protein
VRIVLILLTALLSITPFLCAEDIAVDPEQIIAAAERCEARLKRDVATWTVSIANASGGSAAVVEFLKSHDKRRITLSIEEGVRANLILTIIERNGKWYVNERNGVVGTYRPYEAPTDFSVAYQYLLEDTVLFATRERLATLGSPIAVEEGAVTYRAPLPGNVIQLIESQLQAMKERVAKHPELKDDQKFADLEQKYKHTLDDGVTTKVSLKTGLIIEYGGSNRRVTLRNLNFLENENENDFKIDDRQWPDHTQAWTADDLKNCIMALHWAQFRMHMEGEELPPDIRLLNLKTQEVRRVPVRAFSCAPGCFLADRTKVVVCALFTSGLRLCEVNLLTGQNRQIGQSFPDGAMLAGPVLSHDGKYLAVTQLLAADMSTQLWRLNLENGEAIQMGKPMNCYLPNWTIDDKGLILVKRSGSDPNLPPKGTLYRISIDGELTKIRDGDRPILLGDGKTILFEDSSRTWHTCDLDGKILKDLTDGHQWHMLSSLSPLNDKVLGVKNPRNGKGPEPIIFDPSDGTDTPLTTLPGLWTTLVGR